MMRFGISGCGSFIERAVLPLMKNVADARAVAAFDANGERLRQVCRSFDIPQPCATFDELLRADIDAVYVASPNVFHHDQVIAAAGSGRHVLCQKPMGMNAAECREMLDACARRGVKLAIGFCYPLGGAQQRAKELVREGAIGDVSSIHISFNLGDYSPETVGWRCDPKMSGGGPLMDLAPHLINLACFFLEDRVESVMACVRPQKTDRQVEMDVAAILEFQRGARVTLDTSFVRGNTHNYTLVGAAGEIHAEGTMAWHPGGVLTLSREGNRREVPFSNVEHIEEEIRRFCAAIDKDEAPPFSGQDGLHVQAVLDAVYESGRTGRRCAVAP